MTGRDILNAIGDVDEKYIDEAGKKSKTKKGIIIRFSAMAACLLLAAAGTFAAVNMTKGGIKSKAPEESAKYDLTADEADGEIKAGETDDNANKAGGSTNGTNKSSVSSECYAYRVKKWDEKDSAEKFSIIKIKDTEYSVASKTVPADKVAGKITSLTVLGKDEYTASEYAAKAEIYGIKNISSDCAAAVKYENEDKYYICRNAYYTPETLGQFADDLDLKNTLDFGAVYGTQKQNGKSSDVEYYGWDKEKIWELLFSDQSAKAVKDYDSVQIETAIDISINLQLLGYENISLAVSRDGYIKTNILDTGKAFYIGKAATEKFISYLRNECKTKVLETYDYSEPNYTGDGDSTASHSVPNCKTVK